MCLNLVLLSVSLCCFPECVLVMTKELHLDPLVGYHAIELLQRYNAAAGLFISVSSASAFMSSCSVSLQVHAQAPHMFVSPTHT